MSTKAGAGARRPPSVAVSGHATAPSSRPIRLAPTSAATPVRTKKASASQPGSVKKGTTPKRQPSTGSAGGSATKTKKGATGSVRGSSAGSRSSHAPAPAPAPSHPHAGPSHLSSATHPMLSSHGHPSVVGGPASTAATAPTAPLAVDGEARPPPMTTFAPVWAPSPGGHGHSTTSPSPAMSRAPTLATSAHRSLQLGSAGGGGGAASVAAATSAVTGERYEPTEYKAGFALEGDYTCVVAVPQSAALWVGNKLTGGLDVLSSITGKLTVSLPPRSQVEQARAQEKARQQLSGGKPGAGGTGRDRLQELMFPSTSPSTTPAQLAMGHGGANVSKGISNVPVVRPTALYATRTHVWVGYENGAVAVYDHLVLTFVTEGNFHLKPVVKFAELDDSTVVSASEDGVLVHWDTEAKDFEAIARLPSPCEQANTHGRGARSGSLTGHDGDLSAMVALPKSSVVLCGFHSGALYAVDVTEAARHLNGGVGSELYRPTLVSLHEGRVNALAVLGDVLFSASEDGSVCCSRLQYSLATKGAARVGGATNGSSPAPTTTHGVASSSSGAFQGPHKSVSWRLLKRVRTVPSVRGLLVDKHTLSVYVAYADGLLERWSANPDDDFGVEEVIREGMKIASEMVDDGNNGSLRGLGPGSASVTSGRGQSTVSRKHGTSGAAAVFGTHGEGNREVTGLLAINAVETMQVLALSSNGVNKVWYGHRNLLEENTSTAINALNAVIREDAHDTAVWRERMSLLKAKENERKAKYVLILEQLSEQRLMLQFYEKWRRRVMGASVSRSTEVVVRRLADKADYRLVLRYFGKWASFYDAQQTQFRRHALSRALESATRKAYLVSVLHRWQMNLLQRKVRGATESCADILAKTAAALVVAPCYHKWRQYMLLKQQRRAGAAALSTDTDLDESQMTQMARKAQRQTLHRALARWLDVTDQKQRRTQHEQTWRQYLEMYARLQDAKKAKILFQGWRRWVEKRKTHSALVAVAELRAQQWQIQLQLWTFLRWTQFLHAKRLAAHAAEIRTVEEKLKKAESESGSDIFEKLQLQKHIDQLIQQQETEDRLLQQDRSRLVALQNTRDATLLQREDEHAQRVRGRQPDGSVLMPVSQNTMNALPATNPQSTATPSGTTAASLAAAGVTPGKGPMASHANYFRHLIDQQRLSPMVLSHMPLGEAIFHVMSQLKGNVLNMYTDMGLFRQVKDRRRAGTTAVAIFLENFGEVKRLIVSSLRRGTLKAGSRTARWPLSLEALDNIPTHHCASVLNAIKTMVVSYDLISSEDANSITSTCEEVVTNADWIFLIARACHMRRKPQLPVNNRV